MTGVSTTSWADNTKRGAGSPWRAWLFVFTFFLVIYAMTANRGVQWQDSGSHMLRIVSGDLVNPRGLALSHPLHYWFGRAAIWIGVVSPAFAITLVSSVAGALAVANTFGCVWSLTGRGRAALFAACSLGVAHTFWQMATMTETYTLVAALLSAEMWALILFLRQPTRLRLWLIFAIGGLGVANHNLGGLTLPVVAVVAILAVLRKQVTARDLGIGVILWLLGSLSYSALFVSEVGRSGDFGATLSSALFGNIYRGDVLNLSMSSRRALISAAFFLLNFPGLLLPLAMIGVFRQPGSDAARSIHRALIAGMLIHAVFAVRYSVVDQHTFFIPTYVFIAIFGGVGMDRLLGGGGWCARWIPRASFFFLVLTPLVYAAVPGAARRMDALDGYVRNKPYRDDYAYMFVPWSVSETSAERMSAQAVALANDFGLIVVTDSMSEPAILFKLHRLPQRDVVVARAFEPALLTKAQMEGRSIVFVPSNVLEPPPALSEGQWVRDGDLYVFER